MILSLAIAINWGSLGLFSNPFLVFIALFVWMGATSNASAALTRSVLGGIPVSRVMITRFETLTSTETPQRALDHVLAGFQHDFPVVETGEWSACSRARTW